LLVLSAVLLISPARRSVAESSFKIPDEATARTLDGNTVSLTDYRGKLVFLNVWKTDCIPCLIEIPILNRLQREYSSESFTVIGLAMDRGKDKNVAMLAEKANIIHPIWLGYGQPIARYVDIGITPFLWVLGPDGKLLFYMPGAFPTYEEAVRAMKWARILVDSDKPAKQP
jgi:thiol-disulfide isomerase/thioredoxin